MENDKGKLSQSKDSLSMSPSKNQNRVLRPFNGPAKSPISFKQVNPRMRNTLSTSKVNENIEGEYSDDTASFSNSIPNKLANHDYPPFPHHDLKDFVINNGSLNPSPFKPDHRGFNYSSERNPRRPFESPFMKFCDDLSPLHSRMQTPISNLKNLHVSSEQILKFPFNSPMLLGKLEEPQQNQQYPFKPLPIQKLDFSGFCNSSRPKGNHHHQHHTEQPIEERDESSQHEVSEEEVNEHEHASEEHRNSQSMHDEATRGSHMATEEKPIKFNVRFQKSKYTGSNPFQALSGGQASKTLSHHSKHYDEPMGKHSTGKSLKIEESPNSPARKSMRKLYNDTNTFTTETNHTLHYSERSNRCDHSHGTNSHTASVAKRKNDDDPEDNENESDSSAKKKVTCNCKKSKCLKLYCDCFAAGELCGPECNCCSCHNNEDHNDERNTAILSVLDRNPTAFRPKIDKQEPVVKIVNEARPSLDSKVRHNKGCNCKKSGCLKKYCECYAAGVKCSELCKCETCKNMDPSAIIKKAQSYSQMMYLNSADKRRHYSEEDSNGECESCCSHMHHGDENEEVYDSDPEYRSAYAGRYSSKKTKTSDESINMLGERSSKRSLRNREITPSKPAERGSNHDHYKVEGENTRSNSKKHTSVYRTPFVAVESSKKLNFSQHTPSPSKNHKNQQDRNLRKPPIKPFSSDYHGGGAYAPHPKVKSEY